MKQSTRLGDALGGAMRASAYLFDYAVPLIAITTYRLIPDRTRGSMFGGPSASLATVGKLRIAGGGGWSLIRMAASNHPDRPHLP